MTANSYSVTLPRIRRLRRPPSRLVWLALHALLALCWVIAAVLIFVWEGSWAIRVLMLFAGAMYGREFSRFHGEMRRTLTAWVDGRTIRPVSRSEWRMLGFRWIWFCAWLAWAFAETGSRA
jgi:hypothetical protein